MGLSWRGVVDEIVRKVVGVKVRTDSGVEVRRETRKLRAALLRLKVDSIARIMYIVSRGGNGS